MSNLNQESQDELKAAINTVMKHLNYMGVKEADIGKLISDTVQREHRTIQQTFWRTINEAATDYGRYASVDLRNEGSRVWCNNVSEIETTMPFI